MVRSDVVDRGIPWTQLLHRYPVARTDLNLRLTYRISVIVAYLVALTLVLGVVSPWFLVGVPVGLAAIVGLNWSFYRFFWTKRGALFALGVLPLNLLYHAYNGVSFVVGTSLYLLARRGVRLPGALPAHAMNPSSQSALRDAEPA
jgi:hypothetical protein